MKAILKAYNFIGFLQLDRDTKNLSKVGNLHQHSFFSYIKVLILKLLDFFYPLFRRLMPLQTFRYLACGGSVTVLGLCVYFLSYNFLLPQTRFVSVFAFTVTRYIAAYIISFCVSFPTGFLLSKTVVFPGSYLKGRVQLFRYGTMQGIFILLNWLLLHLFAGYLHFWATPSQALSGIIIAVLSYFFQKYVTFRNVKSMVAPEEKEHLLA